MPNQAKSKIDPSVVHPHYAEYSEQWLLCRDAYAGEKAIKQRAGGGGAKGSWPGAAYLFPLSSHETQEEYAYYRDRAVWYNAVYRTVQGLRGMIFRQPPHAVIPKAIKEHAEDITQDGVNLEQFAKKATDELLIAGRGGILVEYPKMDAPGGGETMSDFEKANRRPFWKFYPAEAILHWRREWRRNRSMLTRIALRETVEVQDAANEFAAVEEERVRILEINGLGQYQQRVFVYQEKEWALQDGPIVPLRAGQPLDFIPFAFLGLGDSAAEVERPPLYDLAVTCVMHYRNSADLENGLHVCGVPTPWAAGFKGNEKGEFQLGSSEAWVTDEVGATAGFLEFTGQGLGAIAQAMAVKVEAMAALGSRVLAPEKRAVETAETALLHRTGENSILADIAGNISAVMEKCLKWHAQWMGLKESEINYQLNRDFFPAPMSPDEIRATLEAWQAGAIAYTDVVRLLKQGEVLDPGREPDDIRAENDMEPKLMATNIANMPFAMGE
ncbi:MAG: DUF4055 domain-containing protein [Candidatus Omnitrophota bacterium]